MLLTKFVPNSIIRRCIYNTNNMQQICTIFAQKSKFDFTHWIRFFYIQILIILLHCDIATIGNDKTNNQGV